MSARTRYLQLSDTTMMEYIVNENTASESDAYIFTKLLDNHYCVFSPLSKEVELENNKYIKRPNDEIVTINTISHLSIPKDNKSSELYYFIDDEYKYVTSDIYNSLNTNNIIAKEYAKYCEAPDASSGKFAYYETSTSTGYDKIRLYFVSGYDFSDIFAVLLRLSVPRYDGALLDLCNFIYTKGSVYKFINYMTKPIIFGNFIYDKYLEIKVPSVKTLYEVTVNGKSLGDIFLGTSESSSSSYEPNLKLVFSYIDESDAIITSTDIFDNNVLVESYSNTNCTFSRTNSLKGTIPVQSLTSDNLGVYIAENPDYPYLEFYGTWKGEALSSSLINNFNTTIKLYDRKYVRKESTYEVAKDYDVNDNLKQWIAVHEITSELLTPEETPRVVKTDTYSMTQIFTNDASETTKFYYRPIYFDDPDYSFEDLTLHIKYLMRFINIVDGVQFLKEGSLSITDLTKYQAKLNRIAVNSNPYKVFNKIIENKQEIVSQKSVNNLKSKYVKVFYDSSQIVLDANGESINNGGYQLNISRAPKNYKFTFKQRDFNNNLKYFDLTDSYYKLYVKETNGNEIIIEPTYSNNMNLSLGELEFNININNINKLKEVDPNDRFMSIISYNADGTTSTMFDMTYTI